MDNTKTKFKTRLGCVLNGFFPHHLDHLAPLSHYLNCPLIVDDPDIHKLATKYYPQIQTRCKRIDVFSASQEFDLLIFTSTKPPIEMQAMAKASGITSLRFAYAPHGFSDKGDLSKRLVNHEGQDIALIHGSEQKRQLEQYGIEKQVSTLIEIGNPRHHFYKEHKAFYDKITNPYKTRRKSILFAPTYEDGYSNIAFNQTQELIENVSQTYQLIIKLHPLLKKQHFIEVTRLEERLKSNPHVHLFCDSMPPVYPFIEHCDIYLGDFSSIGFEFAQSEKPLFLFESSAKSLLAPYATLIKNSKQLLEKLQNEPKHYSFSQMRLKTFTPINPKTIKAQLLKALTN